MDAGELASRVEDRAVRAWRSDHIASSSSAATIMLTALPEIPLVAPGDDLAALIAQSLCKTGLTFQDGDILVIAQKIVSKADARIIQLDSVQVSPRARELAKQVEKDERLVELILSESTRVVRASPGLLIVEHRLGYIMANAGIDQSNLASADAPAQALLLPSNPDASAKRFARELKYLCGRAPAVVINDSFGRPWRRGTVGVALGVHGLPALEYLRGRPDLFGRPLQTSAVALADEVAAAASLLMGQSNEARPAVLVRGVAWEADPTDVTALLRAPEEDRFR